MVFNTIFNILSDIFQKPVHLSMFFLTTSLHNILSKQLAAFPHHYCRVKRQWWERNEFCRNDYHQSSESILLEPKDPTSDLMFSSPQRYQLSCRAHTFSKVKNIVRIVRKFYHRVKTEWVFIRQNKCDSIKLWSCHGRSRKHCGKRRKCWLPAFYPFSTMFSKPFFFRVVSLGLCGKIVWIVWKNVEQEICIYSLSIPPQSMTKNLALDYVMSENILNKSGKLSQDTPVLPLVVTIHEIS